MIEETGDTINSHQFEVNLFRDDKIRNLKAMAENRALSTKEKALRINLDSSIYGSFAEIGAGQEVAANFFKAGGASGTIAKTISAYDMTFSDAIYGQCERYVSEDRLNMMLEKEFRLLRVRLSDKAHEKRFFAFADTIETLNYGKTNQGHGWLGVRFQLDPNTPPNDCIVHLLLHDNDALLQQSVLGVIGVNLIYACQFVKDPDEFIESLVDHVDKSRVEINMLRIEGPDFRDVDNRLLALKLVRKGISNATMFGPDKRVMQPSRALYKKNALILRGRFRPVTNVNVDMLLTGRKKFKKEEDVDPSKIIVLTELTLNDLRDESQEIDEQDFLNRVDIVCSLGQNVMISNYYEYYRLVNYISQYTKKEKIGIILGIYNLKQIFSEQYYAHLRGGILEAFGVLFGHNVKFYVYPSLAKDNKSIYSLDNFIVPAHLEGLYKFLLENDHLENIHGANKSILGINSDEALRKLQAGDPSWVDMVPFKVSSMIKEMKYFGYKQAAEVKAD